MTGTPKRRRPDEIIAFVASAFHISTADIFERDRHRSFVHARTVACLMLRRNGLSYGQIGKIMRRDHSSVINLLQSHQERFRCFGMTEIVERCDQYRLGKIESNAPPRPAFIAIKAAPRPKPRNVFRAKPEEQDSAHEFHANIARGSRKLAEAIALARAA